MLRLICLSVVGFLAIGCTSSPCTTDQPGRVCFTGTDGAVVDHTESVESDAASGLSALLRIYDSGTLTFGPGAYHVYISVSAEHLTVVGAGPGATTLHGDGVTDPDSTIGNVIDLNIETAALTVENLGVHDGTGEYGGAISATYSGQAVTIRNVHFRNNHTNGRSIGGAVHVRGPLLVEDSVFEGNSSERGGAIYAEGAITEVRRSRFEHNDASTGGALNVLSDTLVVSECEMRDNAAFGGAGAIYVQVVDATIERSTIVDNHVYFGTGGGVLQVGGSAVIDETSIGGNSSDRGGAMKVFDGRLAIRNSRFDQNDAVDFRFESGRGGALFVVDSEVTATDSTFHSNTAVTGTAIALDRVDTRSSFAAERCDFSAFAGTFPGASMIANVQVEGSTFSPADGSSFRCDLDGCR